MRPDITNLTSFYDSPLGEVALKAIVNRVSNLWLSLNGLDVLGVGYAAPVLERLDQTARRHVCLMPTDQGGHAWSPTGAPYSAAALSDDFEMPFPDAMFDRILIVHAIEETGDVRRLLREVWRISAPEARILIIAPNRSGLWSLVETTPFSAGRPFSQRQLKRIMRDALIEPTAWTRAIYTPPVKLKFFHGSSEAWERAGETLFSQFGGVNLVEGVKRVRIDPAKPARARIIAPVLGRPIAQSKSIDST